VKAHFPDKEFHTTPMRREVDRCRIALDLAREGRDVAMICSGDAGVYGMAGLIYELRGEDAEPEVEVVEEAAPAEAEAPVEAAEAAPAE
jgi:precorrin-3B C17-methyltransferase